MNRICAWSKETQKYSLCQVEDLQYRLLTIIMPVKLCPSVNKIYIINWNIWKANWMKLIYVQESCYGYLIVLCSIRSLPNILDISLLELLIYVFWIIWIDRKSLLKSIITNDIPSYKFLQRNSLVAGETLCVYIW